MTRFVFALGLILLLSAISLVTARYQSRDLYIQIDRLRAQARELDTDWRRLQLERAELVRNARIDEIGRKELHLIRGTLDRTLFIQGEPLSSVAPTDPQGEQP